MLGFVDTVSSSTDDSSPLPRALVVATLSVNGCSRTPRRRAAARVRRELRGSFELEVAGDGSWFRAAGLPRADCSKRPVLRRLVLALLRAPRGTACSLADLVEAGWPGEKMSRAAARNRLHVSLNRLRTLGLGAVLLTTDDGYMLDPEAVIRVR